MTTIFVEHRDWDYRTTHTYNEISLKANAYLSTHSIISLETLLKIQADMKRSRCQRL